MATRDFEARVGTERAILARVNSRFVSGAPLSGLSSRAINWWCQERPERVQLKDVLLRLGRQLKREAEFSQVTFEVDTQDEMDEAQTIQLLETLIQRSCVPTE